MRVVKRGVAFPSNSHFTEGLKPVAEGKR
jgi:hypothetical protein